MRLFLRSFLPLLLLSLGACAADMDYEPRCDEGSCDEQQKLALVEFCRVDVGLTWDCEDIDAKVNLCDYDGNYRIGGGVVEIEETDGAVCHINALSYCHELRVAPAGTHLVCTKGTVDFAVGFDGLPFQEEGLELCEGLEHWEGHSGYFHDRKFSIDKEGAICSVRSEAFDLPEDGISCHEVTISQEGVTCTVGDFGVPTLYPFVD